MKNVLITVGYINPLTLGFTLWSSIGIDATTAKVCGVLYLRCLNSYSNSYDSRIYEGSIGSFTIENGQGKLVLDAKNVETTGALKSKYYNDNHRPITEAPTTLIGLTDSEHIKIHYQNSIPAQGGHIIIKSSYAITLEAPYININGIINTNVTPPTGIEDIYGTNPDERFEQNNPFFQMQWG